MKLLYLNHVVTAFGNHYLYPTFQVESGTVFTSLNYLISARSKELLDEKLKSYPKHWRIV